MHVKEANRVLKEDRAKAVKHFTRLRESNDGESIMGMPSDRPRLADLHSHLGSSVPPQRMWELAHEQGLLLKTKEYWEFASMITAKPNTSWTDYINIFPITERIQSSPEGVQSSVYHSVSSAYINSNITLLELRFNPMKRNASPQGKQELELDHILEHAIHGLNRAKLDYGVDAGLIFCLDRRWDFKRNLKLVEKAIQYKEKGVIGIDFSDPRPQGFKYSDYSAVFMEARREGLGITAHAGEEEDHHSVVEVINAFSPDRIGHGITSTQSESTMKLVGERGITLEICPTSNLNLRLVKGPDEFKRIFDALREHGIKFTINTDGSEMLMITLEKELTYLLRHNILTPEELAIARENAFNASFIKQLPNGPTQNLTSR